MKNMYFTPEVTLIGVSHEDVICTSSYSFNALNETRDGSTDRVSVNKLLGK